MMFSELFGTRYFEFIFSAYAVTVAALVILSVSIIATHAARKRQLKQMEELGLKRASRKDD